MIDLQFKLTEKLWLYKGDKVSWHLITIPVDDSRQIKFFTSDLQRGWGAVPVNVTIGNTKWKTSIFPDKKSATYILPVKAEIRKKEQIKEGDEVSFFMEVIG